MKKLYILAVLACSQASLYGAASQFQSIDSTKHRLDYPFCPAFATDMPACPPIILVETGYLTRAEHAQLTALMDKCRTSKVSPNGKEVICSFEVGKLLLPEEQAQFRGFMARWNHFMTALAKQAAPVIPRYSGSN